MEDLTIGAKTRAERVGRIPLRPVVHVTLVGPKGAQRVAALVDSGSEHTLAGPWLSRATGVVPGPEAPELEIGIGGATRLVRIAELTMRLHPPPHLDLAPLEWRADVGFIDKWDPPWPVLLGQVGFYDQFTVTMNRAVPAMVIEPVDVFDRRFAADMPVGEADEIWRMPY